jgi:D-arabinose 1-dehydrogenase-like Zn-dependent alcohol dehydrogenase
MASTIGVATMKVAQVEKGGGGIQIVEREIPQPEPGQVRIKVQACGVCHSDALVIEGSWPGIPYRSAPAAASAKRPKPSTW